MATKVKKKKATKPAKSASSSRTKSEEQTHLRAALDGTTVAIMTVNRDLVINFANRPTLDLLRKYEPEFRATFPRFQLDGFIGTCIDIFHKQPEHQRRLLSDPANLPIKTDIKIGRLIFQ